MPRTPVPTGPGLGVTPDRDKLGQLAEPPRSHRLLVDGDVVEALGDGVAGIVVEPGEPITTQDLTGFRHDTAGHRGADAEAQEEESPEHVADRLHH